MRKIFYSLTIFSGILLTSFFGSQEIFAQVQGAHPYLSPEDHKRFLEEGYSTIDITFYTVLGIVGILIPVVFLHPRIRRKFNSYGESK